MPTSRSVRTPKTETGTSAVPSGFDASVLDALLDLGARQHQLEEFRQRAEERRSAVTAAVYERVVKDYQSRLVVLRAEAAPLKRRVRSEYQKLQQVIDGLRKRLETANLDREELEFRREVGEIDEAEFSAKVKDPAGIIESTEAELAGLEEQAARFVEALGPDDDAGDVREPEPEIQPEPEPVREPVRAVEPDEPAGTMLAEFPGDSSPTMIGGAAAGTDPGALGATEYLSPEAILAAAPETPADAGNTVALPDAMLVLEEAGEVTEYPLSLLSYIGRSEGNQVQLARAGVSRRHAMITIGADGRYTIEDLQSQNGTFVNGERVTQATLAHGDRIAVGDVEVTFRSSLAN
jgi:pSer/pThr/pTyr-binding forkhead associated (FHA) protein